MLFDADRRADGWIEQDEFDVCICGAGPAGISLALKLAGNGHKVVLCEGGGLEISAESQELYEGEIVGRDYYPLDVARLRFLGGSTNHWEGWCRHYDAHAFKEFSHMPLSGWPIGKGDLDPYYEEAATILDLPPEKQLENTIFGDSESDLGIAYFRNSPPTRVGEKYVDELTASPNISLVLNANLVDIRLEDSLADVSELIFKSYSDDTPFRIKAKQYVLCLGGLENPRALLNANSQVPAGVGNGRDFVGRCFCEHFVRMLGYAVLRGGRTDPISFAPNVELMNRDKSGDYVIWFYPIDDNPSIQDRFVDWLTCPPSFDDRLEGAVNNDDERCLDARVFVVSEQALNPDSRVMLADEVDRFGLRKICLDWRVSRLDTKTMQDAAENVARLLAETDRGRLKVAEWLQSYEPILPVANEVEHPGYHHMSATRMGNNPQTSVVDRNCRVHEVGNLYIGGSSVFSTSAYANPTFTIVQLALRLADHLHNDVLSA